MKEISDRIVGIETEFGCYVNPELGRPEAAVETIKDHIFDVARLGLIDRHSRDEVFEPALSGGFLMNGSRLYIDAVGSHLEYATAECRSLKDVIACDRAGHRIIVQAIKELGLEDEIDIYNNAVDHFGGHTFGCHENYLMEMDENFFSERAPLLLSFLCTRQIFAGTGRVGGHVLMAGRLPSYDELNENPIDYIWVSNPYDAIPDYEIDFQVSQRPDHILRTVASRVRFNRAMINPKWEQYYNVGNSHRLHLLFGEANQSHYAFALKIGTTCLILSLLEASLIPDELALQNPVAALRTISRDMSLRKTVELQLGEKLTALDLQYRFLELCQSADFSGDDAQWTLREWERTLNDLSRDPMSCSDRLDWVAKYQMLDSYREAQGLDWQADELQSLDLEYHNIDINKSLFGALKMPPIASELDITLAMTDPPQNTRAKARAQIISEVIKNNKPAVYMVDWNAVVLGRTQYIPLEDPFDSEVPAAL